MILVCWKRYILFLLPILKLFPREKIRLTFACSPWLYLVPENVKERK